jgi:diguanylate cyclase (GGDEF)-like protein/PAS domain S-box-containing protein
MIDTLPPTIVSRLVEESYDAVLIIDEHGVIRYLNSAMQALCGYAAREACGQPLSGLLPESMATQHQLYLQRYLRGEGESSVLGRTRDFTIRHRNGELIPIEMKAYDLGRCEGARYLGAFMLDQRPRHALEAQTAALLAQLEQQALSDSLTGLPNRRAFDAEAARACSRAQRNASALTLGVADIDHFKRVNDKYGHPAGDLVLRAVARIISEAARASDSVARTGGEEFGLLFPDAAPEQARSVAERIRHAVADAHIALPDGREVHVTVSIGLAGVVGAGTELALNAANERADAALYRAKNQGRNRTELAPSAPPGGAPTPVVPAA